MGIKAHLARELETLLAQGATDKDLASWLKLNAEVVIGALVISDGMVAIRKIDLNDAMSWPSEHRH